MKKSVLLGALVAAVLLGAVAYATADSVTYTGAGTPRAAAGTVTVKATVNPKLTLTIGTPAAAQTVDFGAVDPGAATAAQTVNLSVSSNKAYDVAKSVGGSSALLGLSTTLAGSTANAKTAATAFSDDYSLNVPWTTDPGAYTATVQYTVTQN